MILNCSIIITYISNDLLSSFYLISYDVNLIVKVAISGAPLDVLKKYLF